MRHLVNLSAHRPAKSDELLMPGVTKPSDTNVPISAIGWELCLLHRLRSRCELQSTCFHLRP